MKSEKINQLLISNNIQAALLLNWDHPNCKFKPNDRVRLTVRGRRATSPISCKARKALSNKTARVIAVTTVDGVRIRSGVNESPRRDNTRYYVTRHGKVFGIDSNYLRKIKA